MKYSETTISMMTQALEKLDFRHKTHFQPDDIIALMRAFESTDEQKQLRADAGLYRWLRLHSYRDRIGVHDCILFGRGINQAAPELLDGRLDMERGA